MTLLFSLTLVSAIAYNHDNKPAPYPQLSAEQTRLFDAAKAKIDEGKFDDALAIIERLAAAVTRDPLVQYYTAEVAYLSGDYGKSVRYCGRAIEFDRKSLDAFTLRAHAFLRLSKYDRAEADFTRAAELAPTNVDLFYHRAVCRRALGKHDSALEDVLVVRKSRSDRDARHLHALILCDNLHLKTALTEIEAVLRKETKFVEGYLLKGLLLTALERDKAAEAEFATALELDSTTTEKLKTLREEAKALGDRYAKSDRTK